VCWLIDSVPTCRDQSRITKLAAVRCHQYSIRRQSGVSDTIMGILSFWGAILKSEISVPSFSMTLPHLVSRYLDPGSGLLKLIFALLKVGVGILRLSSKALKASIVALNFSIAILDLDTAISIL
jgi:hypothetical protein